MLSADISKTQELLRFVEESRPSLEQIAKKQKTVVRQKSALYLLHHNKYLALITAATIAYSKEDKEKAVALVEQALNHFLSSEEGIMNVADVFLISERLKGIRARMQR